MSLICMHISQKPPKQREEGADKADESPPNVSFHRFEFSGNLHASWKEAKNRPQSPEKVQERRALGSSRRRAGNAAEATLMNKTWQRMLTSPSASPRSISYPAPIPEDMRRLLSRLLSKGKFGQTDTRHTDWG